MRKFFGLNSYVVMLVIIMFFIIVVIANILATRGLRDEGGPSPTPMVPTAAPPARTNPPVEYAPTATQSMLDALSDPAQLSQSDLAAKERVLSFLPPGQASGVLYESPSLTIDYTSSADQIQAEILTVDINRAKTEAVDWLASQGLSQDGICSLPVVFYLNLSVANELEDLNISFSPLADGC